MSFWLSNILPIFSPTNPKYRVGKMMRLHTQGKALWTLNFSKPKNDEGVMCTMTSTLDNVVIRLGFWTIVFKAWVRLCLSRWRATKLGLIVIMG